jgi:hypothetical protein
MNYFSGLVVLMLVFQGWCAFPNGPSSEGTVDANKLLQWVASHKTAANLKVNNGFANREGEAMNVSLYQVGTSSSGATFFESNMDVDCDGSDNGDCNSFDPSHQSTLSCGCSVNEGGPVDASSTPFFVIPIGSPFNAGSRGINIGQVAACIYKTGASVGIAYAIFLDEDGVSTEIGEGSAYLNRFLGINPDPNNGGSESGNTYIVFPGSGNRTSNYSNHSQVVSIGVAAANALLANYPLESIRPGASQNGSMLKEYQISMRTLSITALGSYSLSILLPNGRCVVAKKGAGPGTYDLSLLKPGAYIVTITTARRSYIERALIN